MVHVMLHVTVLHELYHHLLRSRWVKVTQTDLCWSLLELLERKKNSTAHTALTLLTSTYRPGARRTRFVAEHFGRFIAIGRVRSSQQARTRNCGVQLELVHGSPQVRVHVFARLHAWCVCAAQSLVY